MQKSVAMPLTNKSTFLFKLFCMSLIFIGLAACSSTTKKIVVGNSSTTKQAMVVAAEENAARAGALMIQKGGNAVDAAVAVGFALAVTYPVAGNLGGGGFMVVHLPHEDGDIQLSLDFRECAPLLASPELFSKAAEDGNASAATLHHLSVGVPGSVAGLLHAQEKWGKLSRQEVMAPAIKLASEGFAMTKATHGFLSAPSIQSKMKLHQATAKIFYPNGAVVAVGELFKQKDLARCLSLISEKGAAGFYQGEMAQALVNEMIKGKGLISAQDLLEYEVKERALSEVDFKGYKLLTMAPPSSGGVCLPQMLKMLETFPLAKWGHNSPQSLHVIAETMRRSFALRNTHLGDPDFSQLPLEWLFSDELSQKMQQSIDLERASSSKDILNQLAIDPNSGAKEKEQTTHYSIVDNEGGAVSVTTTLNGAFGSKVLVPGAGYLLNNEMDDFTTRAGVPNQFGLIQGVANLVGPKKRPLSSMSPSIALGPDGKVAMVMGSPGGPTIITNVLQVFLNLSVFKLSPWQAVSAAKIHHQCLPDRIDYEGKLHPDIVTDLSRRGHDCRARLPIGDFQLIVVDLKKKQIYGISDPRGGGAAAGL